MVVAVVLVVAVDGAVLACGGLTTNRIGNCLAAGESTGADWQIHVTFKWGSAARAWSKATSASFQPFDSCAPRGDHA